MAHRLDGNRFIELLEAAIAPLTITGKTGTSEGVKISLSDDRTILAKRKAIQAAATEDEMNEYVQSLVG